MVDYSSKILSMWHLFQVEFIDYGTPATLKSSELRFLSKEFSTFPAQAIWAKLISVKPMNGEMTFPLAVCQTFLGLVESKRLVANVFRVAKKIKNGQVILSFHSYWILCAESGCSDLFYFAFLFQYWECLKGSVPRDSFLSLHLFYLLKTTLIFQS